METIDQQDHDMVDITFGVLNYNPGNHPLAESVLRKCLLSLHDNISANLKSEVYVIDQASEGHTQQHIVQEYCNKFGWRSILLEKNIGISRGINMLARIARGRYVCLVTSDTEFTKDLDISLMNTLCSNPHVWQVCPASDKSELEHQRVGYQPSGLVYTLAAHELTILMWPRTTFDKIGYFDERWKACFENMDFALRIFLAGGNIAVSHDVYCPHEHAMSIKSGARNHTYDDYITMSDGFNQDILHRMWDKKWEGLPWSMLYQPPIESVRSQLAKIFKHNIYLDYVQNVGY
jgi:GT2 family glycosyltransferase